MRALRRGSERFEPVVRRSAEGFEVALAGRRFRFALDEDAPGVFVLRDGGRSVRFHAAWDSKAAHLFWDGVAYTLALEREGARPSEGHDSEALEAPMPGRVSEVKTAPGERVTKGQELVVVEAMKMENALRAPRAGVVRAVHARPGDMVAPGRSLVELEREP